MLNPGTYHTTTVSAVIVAKDGIGHLEGHIVWVGPTRSLYCNGNMGQRQGIITVADLKEYMLRLRNSTARLSGTTERMAGVGETCTYVQKHPRVTATGPLPNF